jgi:hypothetical protein
MADSTDSRAEGHRGTTDDTADGSLDATGIYETAGGIVFYDTEEPLAWIQADNAVRLDEAV